MPLIEVDGEQMMQCENCGNIWDGYAQCNCWQWDYPLPEEDSESGYDTAWKNGETAAGRKGGLVLSASAFFTSLIFILWEIWLLFKIGSKTLLEKQFIVDIH